MGHLYVALVHYPVRGRYGETIATAITGLDIHDIARSARTFGVHRFYVITPLHSQQEIARRIVRYWLDQKEFDLTHRAEALENVEIVESLEESLERIEREEGRKPLLIGTSARIYPERPQISYGDLRRRIEETPESVYILFGTGWGLADEVIERVDFMLPPVRGVSEYNHLSVRAAAAIVLHCLRGRCEEQTS